MADKRQGGRARTANAWGVAMAGLLASLGLSGCMVIGASSRGGFFVWPGGLGLLVLVLAVVFLLRRR